MSNYPILEYDGALNAVLEPEEHDYLYYHVEDESTGKHVFSETYEVREVRDYDSAGRSVPESIVGYRQCKVCGQIEEVYVIETNEW